MLWINFTLQTYNEMYCIPNTCGICTSTAHQMSNLGLIFFLTIFNAQQTNSILTNNQPDTLFHVFIYFMSLHVSSITVLIIRRLNCINTFTAIVDLSRSNFSIAHAPLFQLKSAM